MAGWRIQVGSVKTDPRRWKFLGGGGSAPLPIPWYSRIGSYFSATIETNDPAAKKINIILKITDYDAANDVPSVVIPRSGSISANLANVYEDYEGSIDSSIIAATGIGTSLYTIVGNALSAYFGKTIVPTEGDEISLKDITPYQGIKVPMPTLYYRDASFSGYTIFMVVDSEGQVLDFNGQGLVRKDQGLYELASSFPPTTESWGKNQQGAFSEGVKTFDGVDYTFTKVDKNKYTITPELGEWQ